jgi:hypothetical protein
LEVSRLRFRAFAGVVRLVYWWVQPAKVSGDVIRKIHDREPPVIDLPGRQLKRVD